MAYVETAWWLVYGMVVISLMDYFRLNLGIDFGAEFGTEFRTVLWLVCS